MVKYKVSTDFSSNKFSDKELSVRVDSIVVNMTGNALFPTPMPSLTSIKESNTRFAAALVKMEDGNKQDTANKRKSREELEGLMGQLALYVQSVSGGDEAIILRSGFDTNKKPAPVGQLDKPGNLKAKPDENKGSLIISWDPVDHANFYEFKYTEAPSSDTSMWNLLTTTKHRMQVGGLTSGKQYTFKVAGASADSSRIWSDEITSYVL
jgi:hypothetical protein